MFWRGVQYFFGGVLQLRCLHCLHHCRCRRCAPAAAATAVPGPPRCAELLLQPLLLARLKHHSGCPVSTRRSDARVHHQMPAGVAGRSSQVPSSHFCSPAHINAGAMSVFTTKSLLASLGVSNKRTGEAAAAINWVVKDGAGRLGRFLFARW